MHKTIKVTATVLTVTFYSCFAGCNNIDTPTSASQQAASSRKKTAVDPTLVTQQIWEKLTSTDPAVVKAGVLELSTIHPDVFTGASYRADAPPTDELQIGTIRFRVSGDMIKRWNLAFLDAFPTDSAELSVPAYIALDRLGAGIMSSGKSFAEQWRGVRSDAYERALIVRRFALEKLVVLAPTSSYSPVEKLAAVREIARSNKVAEEIP